MVGTDWQLTKRERGNQYSFYPESFFLNLYKTVSEGVEVLTQKTHLSTASTKKDKRITSNILSIASNTGLHVYDYNRKGKIFFK